MKVVTIEELKNMPDGTVFAEFTPNIYIEELMVLDGRYLDKPGFNGIEYVYPQMDWNEVKPDDKWDNDDPTKCDYPMSDSRTIIDTTDYDLDDGYGDTKYFAVFSEIEVYRMVEALTDAVKKTHALKSNK